MYVCWAPIRPEGLICWQRDGNELAFARRHRETAPRDGTARLSYSDTAFSANIDPSGSMPGELIGMLAGRLYILFVHDILELTLGTEKRNSLLTTM